MPLTLPPCRNGYSRTFYPGRVCSAYFDCTMANHWEPHVHEDHDQVAGIVGDGSVRVRYLGPDNHWQEMAIDGAGYWIIPRGIRHSLICGDGVDLVKLYLEARFVEEFLGSPPQACIYVPLPLLASRDQVIPQHTKLFQRLCRRKDRELPAYIESIATVLGTHVLSAIVQGETSCDGHRGMPDDRLVRVIAHIDRHLAEPLTNTSLAAVVHFSEGHFSVLFKRSMGIGPHEYVMRRRQERAIELLKTTNRKELDIAHSCGFSDDTHMGRRIKQTLGCLPSQLRPRAESEKEPKAPSSRPSRAPQKSLQ